MWNLILRVAGSSAGIWLASEFVHGVRVSGNWKTFIVIGSFRRR